MLKEISGDLLMDSAGIICHQVNYHGVMGAGVAASIRKRLLTPEQYAEYVRYCARYGRAGVLGTVQYIRCNNGLIVANMFCQDELKPQGNTITQYDLMELCFKDVLREAESRKCPVFIPGHIGCGIAGGDWNRVKAVIEKVFAPSVSVTAVIVNREEG